MRTLLLLSVAFVISTSAAQAETFTFTGKGTQVFQIAGMGPAGRPAVATHSKNEVEIVWASGAKTKNSGNCIGWTAPPNSGFTAQAFCNGTDQDGATTFSVIGCMATNDKGTESDCWGRVTYTSGKNKGRVATISSHGKQNPDGKGGTSVGTGVLY